MGSTLHVSEGAVLELLPTQHRCPVRRYARPRAPVRACPATGGIRRGEDGLEGAQDAVLGRV